MMSQCGKNISANKKMNEELIWKTAMALTEMSPRTEYLQPHPELTANIIPSIPHLASESGGALLSIGGVLLKKTASFCLNCWFSFFKALICVLHHCHWFNWFVLHCYHPISLTLWANKVLIGDVVRTHSFNGCTRFTNYLSIIYLESRQLCISNLSCIF